MPKSPAAPLVHVLLEERFQVLRAAAAVLEGRWPQLQHYLTVWIGPNQVAAHAVFVWPGVLVVSLRYDGRLIARSKPGKPLELDLSAFQ